MMVFWINLILESQGLSDFLLVVMSGITVQGL